MTPLGDDIIWRLLRSDTFGHAILEVETSNAYTNDLISCIHIEGRFGVIEQTEDYDLVSIEDSRASLADGQDLSGELERWRELERSVGITLLITATSIRLAHDLARDP